MGGICARMCAVVAFECAHSPSSSLTVIVHTPHTTHTPTGNIDSLLRVESGEEARRRHVRSCVQSKVERFVIVIDMYILGCCMF